MRPPDINRAPRLPLAVQSASDSGQSAARAGTQIRTAPMAAGGVYNRNSRVQQRGPIPGMGLLERAASAVDLPDAPQPIMIADYGCSGGRNSLAPVATAIEALRRRADTPITVAHSDLPDNDFSALFDTLWNDPASYTAMPAVFPMAIGRSFYHQVLPHDSVTLGWSSFSVNWLSRPPSAIPDHVQVSYSADRDARSAYARRAEADWRDFLIARGAEMRAGARLVVVLSGADDDGTAGYRPMFDAAWAGLRALVDEGLLDEDEAVQMGMPHFGRGAADLAAPFGDGHFAGLTIEELETFDSGDEFWDDYQSNGDAAGLGARWAGIFAAGAFPSLATGLRSGPGDPRTAAILDRLQTEVAGRLAAAPAQMSIPVANVVLTKIGKG